MTKCEHVDTSFAGLRRTAMTDDEIRYECPNCEWFVLAPRCLSYTKWGAARCKSPATLEGKWCAAHLRRQYDESWVPPPSPSQVRREKRMERIRELRASGLSVRQVAAKVHCSHSTVMKALS